MTAPSESSGDSDSARELLESLARDRGTKLLPEQDYQEMRRAILDELACGPHIRMATLFTFGAVVLLLFGLLLVGFAMWTQGGPANWLLPISSGGCLIICGWFLRRYIVGIREQSRMSVQERLAEVEDLRRHQLINQSEYDEIFAAIHSSRIPR